MAYYVNCLKSYSCLDKSLKDLVPDMNLRRRMGPGMKMGVSTAMAVLEAFAPYGETDAIITATGLGCIADSEKFLSSMLGLQEQALNPTPFIQSTFNAVGASIALLRGEHGYNNTFSHRETGFECALLDAMLLLDAGEAKAVLVGFFEEATSSVSAILDRMGLTRGKDVGEGAVFLVLTRDCLPCSQAEIRALSFEDEYEDEGIFVSKEMSRYWAGAFAELVHDVLVNAHEGEEQVIVNDLNGQCHSKMCLRCLLQE